MTAINPQIKKNRKILNTNLLTAHKYIQTFVISEPITNKNTPNKINPMPPIKIHVAISASLSHTFFITDSHFLEILCFLNNQSCSSNLHSRDRGTLPPYPSANDCMLGI